MDDGDSNTENTPPNYYIVDWIGHGLYLRE